ncbi:MAG: hypothetical protein EBU51_08450 [Synechococcaceae bacterium WB6_3A_227]|nr:hypothetical protein [Synechococcaceae bacterium WB6_3A_227]
MALHIIEEAERQGVLKPGGLIIENTSGNTGIDEPPGITAFSLTLYLNNARTIKVGAEAAPP